MPASSSSSASCQRLACRLPGALRVGQLVEQQQLRLAGEGGVEVELVEGDAAVLDLARRQALQPFGQGRGLRPAVGLHPADHDVHALGCFRARAASSMA